MTEATSLPQMTPTDEQAINAIHARLDADGQSRFIEIIMGLDGLVTKAHAPGVNTALLPPLRDKFRRALCKIVPEPDAKTIITIYAGLMGPGQEITGESPFAAIFAAKAKSGQERT